MSEYNHIYTSNFELLRDRNIISILNGDVDFGILEINGIDSGIKISMPYLNGPTLCDISNKFGLNVTYGWSGGAKSRWIYLDDLIDHCIQNKTCSKLLSLLFSKGQFVNKLKGQTPEIIDYSYSKIINIVIDQINSILYLSGNELTQIDNVLHILL